MDPNYPGYSIGRQLPGSTSPEFSCCRRYVVVIPATLHEQSDAERMMMDSGGQNHERRDGAAEHGVQVLPDPEHRNKSSVSKEKKKKKKDKHKRRGSNDQHWEKDGGPPSHGAEGTVLRRHHAREGSHDDSSSPEDAEGAGSGALHPPTAWPGRAVRSGGAGTAAFKNRRKGQTSGAVVERDGERAHEERRRASEELPRRTSVWHRERTPRRGILVRSRSEESLMAKKGSKRGRKHGTRRHDECVKFDRVVVRYYPREVGLGGCMLDPKKGPFLGIGWNWDRETFHSMHAFERLREPARKVSLHAMASQDRYALLRNSGLPADEIEKHILEMKNKSKELTRRASGPGLLPSLWPWKKSGPG